MVKLGFLLIDVFNCNTDCYITFKEEKVGLDAKNDWCSGLDYRYK